MGSQDAAVWNWKVVPPPGFHFYPTDEELVVHFLEPKANSNSNSNSVVFQYPEFINIPDLHSINTINPWELQGKALQEGNKWYFYTTKTTTHNMHMHAIANHPSTHTTGGHWKSMGPEEPVFSTTTAHTHHDHNNNNNIVVGMKHYYVFCLGTHASSHVQTTNWIMQQFRLITSDHHHHPISNSSSSSSRSISQPSSKSKSKSKPDHMSKWVLCRVYEQYSCDVEDLDDHHDSDNGSGMELSCMDEVFLSLDDDDLDEITYPNN